MPSLMPQHPASIEKLDFDLEWSFAREVDERFTLSSIDKYRRVVLSAGGEVRRCEADAGPRTSRGRVVRMCLRCDRATITALQSEMIADEMIALHLVRRVNLPGQGHGYQDTQRAAASDGIGLVPSGLDAINALIDKRITEQIRSAPAFANATAASLRMLNARDVGVRLGNLSDQTVRIREKEGKLFSILRPNRQRGREYPEYQLETGIQGRPLNAVLRVLAGRSGEEIHAFFTTPVPMLGELTPLEVLRGVAFVNGPADQLLVQSAEQRLAAVIEAARDCVKTP
jgi:hypothetical protein